MLLYISATYITIIVQCFPLVKCKLASFLAQRLYLLKLFVSHNFLLLFSPNCAIITVIERYFLHTSKTERWAYNNEYW